MKSLIPTFSGHPNGLSSLPKSPNSVKGQKTSSRHTNTHLCCNTCIGMGQGTILVGVAKGQLLPKIYKYAYTKMAPIGASGGQWRSRGAKPPCPPPPTSSAYVQGGPKKVSLRSLHITSSNTGRFSNFFHCHILQEICNKVIIKYPTSPQTCRYTTL